MTVRQAFLAFGNGGVALFSGLGLDGQIDPFLRAKEIAKLACGMMKPPSQCASVTRPSREAGPVPRRKEKRCGLKKKQRV